MSEIFIGIDIVEIKRIKHLINRYQTRFLTKIFSIKEQEYCNGKALSEIHYAGKFAAKEAVLKAIMSSGNSDVINFTSIEIINSTDGAPEVKTDLVDSKIKISISHTDKDAIAFALLLTNK